MLKFHEHHADLHIDDSVLPGTGKVAATLDSPVGRVHAGVRGAG